MVRLTLPRGNSFRFKCRKNINFTCILNYMIDMIIIRRHANRSIIKNISLTNCATFLLYSDTQCFYSLSITEGIFVFTTVFKHIIKFFLMHNEMIYKVFESYCLSCGLILINANIMGKRKGCKRLIQE